jgi:hypothetical protein
MTEEIYNDMLQAYRRVTSWNDVAGGDDVSWALERALRRFMDENPRPTKTDSVP